MTKVLISAGEASGDFYGAELAGQIKKLDGKAEVMGFGGPRMAAAGVDVRLDLVSHAVMGYWEALKTLPAHLSNFSRAKSAISEIKPDVLVVIDSPSFHMPLIKEARRLGAKKIIYYSTPQVWIWKYRRIFDIKKYADLCINVLPFEKAIFEKHGIRAVYFGHPSAPFMKSGGAKKKGAVGIFPGSRLNEVRYFFDDIMKACSIIKDKKKNVKFTLFRPGTIPQREFESRLAPYSRLNVRIVEGWDLKTRASLSAAIAKSGTITLELALLGVPEAVVYRVSPVSYFIMRSLAKGGHVSLPNIILKKEAVREFIQGALKPADVAAEVLRLLDDGAYRKKMMSDFSKLKKIQGPAKYAVINAAKAVLKEARS